MEIHRFQESFAFQLRVDCESIWRRFGIDLGSIWDLGRVLGGFGASLGAQDRILMDFKWNLGSIWDRFGSIWGLGRIFGGFGAPLSVQDRSLIDFKLVLGPLVGPSRPQLGGLEASWGVLWLSLGSREPF